MKRKGIILASALGLASIFLLAMVNVMDIAPQQENNTAPSLFTVELEKTRADLEKAMNLLVTCFGEDVQLAKVQTVPVTITAYSSTVDQCDSTPHITASLKPVRVGTIAVSPDMIKELGLFFGQRVLLPGYGIFEVRDLMNPRWKRRVDIWESDREAARFFGLQKGTLIWVAGDRKKA